MTRDEMKMAILRLEAVCEAIGAGPENRQKLLDEMLKIRRALNAQIDLMFQGAADDESFNCPPGCSAAGKPYCHCQSCGETGVPLNEDGYCHGCSCIELNPDNCSYCGEPIATDPMTHKDGDCLEAKILARD